MLRHRIKNSYEKVFVVVMCAVTLSLIAYFVSFLYRNWQEKENHSKIEAFLNDEIEYDSANLKKEETEIIHWINSDCISANDKGCLYEQLAGIYNYKNETLEYSQALGCAIACYDEGGNEDEEINLYLNLINFFMQRGNTELAEDTLNHVLEIKDIKEIEDDQIRCYALRTQASIDIYNKEYSIAEEELIAARNIAASYDKEWAKAYIAMIDVRLARIYYETGRNDLAQVIINEYNQSEYFKLNDDARTIIQDFVLPYYEVKIYLLIESNTQQKALQNTIAELEKSAEEQGLYRSELNMLMYLTEEVNDFDVDYKQELENKKRNIYIVLTNSQGHEYSDFVNSAFVLSDESISNEYTADKNHNILINFIILMSILIIGAVCVFGVFVFWSRIDGLTGIPNRRSFDQEYYDLLKKSDSEYAIIMMDIDDFKSINDTFGHQSGDEVLSRLGNILIGTANSEIKFFRYGGEEFTGLVTRRSLRNVEMLAKHIQSAFEGEEWTFTDKPITLSIGVAYNKSGVIDVLKEADRALYYSKEHGKNQVTVF